MDVRYYTEQCLLFLLVLLVTVEGYVGPSCRRCMHTGDWAACATCYNSRPGVVPFYGMSKRGMESQPLQFDEDTYTPDEPNVYEVDKRASHLVTYCCMHLHDDNCCDALGITPYFGKRSYSTVYDMYGGEGCQNCLNKQTFAFSYCLNCLRKRK